MRAAVKTPLWAAKEGDPGVGAVDRVPMYRWASDPEPAGLQRETVTRRKLSLQCDLNGL